MARSRSLLLALTLLGMSVRAHAGDAAVAGGNDAASAVEAGPTTAAALLRQARDIDALRSGTLDPAVEPATLFDISLADEATVRVDAARIRALLREVDGAPVHADAGAAAAHGDARGQPAADARADAAADAPADAHAESAETRVGAPEPAIDPLLWEARISLDRARLAFYELPADRRVSLLAEHQRRQRAAAPPPSAAELREREANEQRDAALRAARDARTEAERVVSTELARLLEVEHAQTALAKDFARQRAELVEQREVTLGWQQRALTARRDPGSSADRTYEELRGALRAARAALSQALDRLGGAPNGVPGAGPDALAGLHADVDTREARDERDRVEESARRLAAEEEALRRQSATELVVEIDTLNAERLSLLGSLSPEKRSAVTGFTSEGWDQASSELRQLTLILRYHRYGIGEWLVAMRHPGPGLGRTLAGAAIPIVEWLALLTAFLWWRRRAPAFLRLMHRRAHDADRTARVATPGLATRGFAFLSQVHRPIEWLTLIFCLRSTLSSATQDVLEVRVVWVFATWILGAAFVVDVINALAESDDSVGSQAGRSESGALRFRSLRLIGRVIVGFGLVLAISAMLVGNGTIYQWVFRTCWFASIPLVLVLVRWWRITVFARTERVRRPSRAQRWALEHREGWWTSFAAAAVAAGLLLANGAVRAFRNRIGRFDVTRRALAYLFRRQLGKRETKVVLGQLADADFVALGPEQRSMEHVANDADAAFARVAERIRLRKGGVVAIVGERGMGKTTALRRLAVEGDHAILVDACADREALRARFAESLALPSATTFAEQARALAASPHLHALLVDNAHRFVRPVMGGLATFDEIVHEASNHAGSTTWVFAIDQVVWQFLERARGARPLFDEVVRLDAWREEEIVSLLQARTREVGLTPSFEGLLERLPATADEIDREEALGRLAADYYRLIWDAARGNPGVALHMWRRSLGTDADGKTVALPTSILDTSDLERLPDSAVFVLRAVLQLAPARADGISQGTLIRLADVTDALRYAASRGYVEEVEGGYRVTWTWFRAVTLFLQRKHLLLAR